MFCAVRKTPTESAAWRFLLGRHTCVRVCGAITYRTKHTGAAPQCLLAKAPKGTKSAFVPRRQTDDAVTGGDVSRIARNSHRKRRAALSVFDGAGSVGRKSVSPHAGGVRKAALYADMSGGHILPASAGRSSVDRIRTECPINIARRSGTKVRGRPAGGLLLRLSRGVEIAHGNFACRKMASGKSNFCILLFAYKSMWLPGIRQKGAAGSSADIPAYTCGAVWPRR